MEAATGRASAPKAVGFRAEFLANLDEMQEKIPRSRPTVPAEKYSWRPAADVRSVSEVYMHIAGGNYLLSTFVGVAAAEDGRATSRRRHRRS